MDMRNNKRRNVLTHARVNFSQSETSSLLHGGGGELNFELLLWGGVNRKDPQPVLIFEPYNFPILPDTQLPDSKISEKTIS